MESSFRAYRRVLSSLILVLFIGSTVPATQQEDVSPNYSSTAHAQLIAKLQPGWQPVVVDGRWRVVSAANHATSNSVSAYVAFELDRWHATEIRKIYDESFAQRLTPVNREAHRSVRERIGLDRYYRIRVPHGTNTQAMALCLAQMADVFEAVESDCTGSPGEVIPDDELFCIQWALLKTGQVIDGVEGLLGADINVTEAWDITTGSDQVTLAVLDSGILDHEDLGSARIVAPYNCLDPGSAPMDGIDSHGTHVAGIAAADGNNEIGIAGVNWSCNVMPVKVTGLNSPGYNEMAACGIMWAVENGAGVIHMSNGTHQPIQILHDAVLYAYSLNVPIVAITHNRGCAIAYPAKYRETIAVGGVGPRDDVPACCPPPPPCACAPCSPYFWAPGIGDEIDLAAPGWSIMSLVGTSGYEFKTGTSMAGPHVSGVVSLMLTVNPDLSVDEIDCILRKTAKDVHTSGWDMFTGCGRVDAAAAVYAACGDTNEDGIINVDDLMNVILDWGTDGTENNGNVKCDAPIDAEGCAGGTVDVDDLVMVILSWCNLCAGGTRCATSICDEFLSVGLSQSDCDDFQAGTYIEDENYRCWLAHYLSGECCFSCPTCPPTCPGPDPFGGH